MEGEGDREACPDNCVNPRFHDFFQWSSECWQCCDDTSHTKRAQARTDYTRGDLFDKTNSRLTPMQKVGSKPESGSILPRSVTSQNRHAVLLWNRLTITLTYTRITGFGQLLRTFISPLMIKVRLFMLSYY